MSGAGERYLEIRAAIDEAAISSGRAPDDVSLVAVSKGHDVDAIVSAWEAGARDFGENRVEELVDKLARVGERLGPERAATIRWHFIGELQSRKIKRFPAVSLVHSLYRSSQLSAFGARVGEPPQPALVQVNVGGEAAKGGVSPAELLHFVQRATGADGIEVRGLMMIGPRREAGDAVRADFDALVDLRRRCLAGGIDPECLQHLSMGMSGDFTLAVERGSTLVRVGTAIFGRR